MIAPAPELLTAPPDSSFTPFPLVPVITPRLATFPPEPPLTSMPSVPPETVPPLWLLTPPPSWKAIPSLVDEVPKMTPALVTVPAAASTESPLWLPLIAPPL